MASIDIIVPNYNYANYLPDAIKSILCQDFCNFRVLIMDNASKDNSVAIARQLASEDSRIHVLERRVNIGLAGSLNEGNDWAEADYLLALSADDLLPEGALSRGIDFLERHPEAVAVFGQCLFFSGKQTPPLSCASHNSPEWDIKTGPQFIKHAMTKHMVTLSPMVRTSIQKKCGDYRKEAPSLDAEMWWRWACHGHIGITKAPQAIQRLHDENISGAFWKDPGHRFEKAITTQNVFFAHEGGQLKQARKLQKYGRHAVGKDAYWSACSHALRGELKTAAKLYKLAIQLCPTAALLPPFDYLNKYQDLTPRLKKAASSLIRFKRAA